jgi:4-amino-4-deoxy-L-arabinose transferase-like glycosyltransferase
MTNDKSQMTSGRRCPALVICLLFICSFALRLAPLGRYVTPDEPAWVYRAIRFVDALAVHDWTAIPNTGHPGVTTMWLGAAGVTARRLLTPAESTVHLDWIRRMAWLAPENGKAFQHLAFFLPWGRAAVALVTTLGLVALYLLLVRLFDRRVVLLAVGLLAFDPFLIGHSGLLHTDALLATFVLLALATALNGLQEPHRAAWWNLSGLFTGLALLTKTPAIVLPPFILLLCTVAVFRHNSQSTVRSLRLGFVHCSSFIILTAVTLFALYPALWVNPADAFRTLSAFAGRHIETAQRPVFFAGQMSYDPGPLFYPIVFLLRVSPPVLVGLAIGLVTLRRLSADRRLAFLLLLAFAIGFGALMSLGAKKHDRYLLPALPPFALAAALGWESVKKRVTSTWDHERRTSSAHLLTIPVIIQLTLTLPFTRYPLTAFNLLAGGPWVAARVLSTDWGEGMGATARWLNERPDADQLTVAAPSVPTFASVFKGHTTPLDQATQADYIVSGPNQLAGQPVYTATLGFLDHAVVLSNTVPFEQSAYLATHAGSDDLILLDANTSLLRQYTGPGTLVSVADLPDPAAIAARLADLSAGRSQLWLVADPAASPITVAHLRRMFQSGATPSSTATVAGSTITQYPMRNIQHPTPHTQTANFDNQIALVDALAPDAPVNTPFPVLLRWQVPAPTPTNLDASLHLRDSAGHLWAEVGQLVLNDTTFPTSAWVPGEWSDNVLTLKPPDHIPPDTYVLQLTITDGEGAQLGAWGADDQFQGVRVPLGDVEIAPPAEPAQQFVSQLLCEDDRVLSAGPLQACAPQLPRQAIPSGDLLTLALTWSSTTPPKADFRIRWRLLDTANSIALEQTTALSRYPTSRWRAGDTFEARYDLRLDPSLPAARYILALNVLAPDGHPLWATDDRLATVEILSRDRLFELPAGIGHPLGVKLGDVAHLRGFDLSRTQASPGDTLPLTLYWQASGPAELDYTVFVHLVGPDGHCHGQVDRYPAAGAAPTTSWVLGQVIVDEISLPVASDAPEGLYHIAVGLYDATSGGRLPIADRAGDPLPDGQAILPIDITIAGGSQ